MNVRKLMIEVSVSLVATVQAPSMMMLIECSTLIILGSSESNEGSVDVRQQDHVTITWNVMA